MITEPPISRESAGNSVLIVLDADDPANTLRAVEQGAKATAAELYLLLTFSTAEYEQRRRARIDAGVPGPYTINQLEEEAQRIAQRMGRKYLGRDGYEFKSIGAVGQKRDCVREVARKHNCGTVYLPEEPRSVWQRLLGRADLAANVAQTLPNSVSVVSVDGVASPPTDDPHTDAIINSDPETTPSSPDK